MDPSTPKPPPKGEARRRLLRGSLAAPAALTLLSGRALAQTSATCIERQAASRITGSAANSTAYASVATYKLTKDSDPTKFTLWVARADLNARLPKRTNKILDTFMATANNFVCVFDNDGGKGFKLGEQLPAAPSKKDWTYGASGNSVGVLFNSSGDITGVALYDPLNAGTALTTSCWNSINRP